MENSLREKIASISYKWATEIGQNLKADHLQCADEILKLLATEGYGKMVMPDCKYVAGFRVHPELVFEPIKIGDSNG